MEITTQPVADRYELHLQGRLDANWADHVGQAVESAIRAGHHQIDLDFSGVNYVSSAGIRVLVKHYKQLKSARGTLRVVRPVESVLSVLKLSGVADLLMATLAAGAAAGVVAAAPAVREWERAGVQFEAHEIAPGETLVGQLHGQPEALANGRLSAVPCHQLRCAADVLAVGLGAFSSAADDREERFGESLAVAGAAVTLPTDGSNVPDYQVVENQLVPELQLVYGITAKGSFSRLIRFEAARSLRGVVTLAELVEAALENLAAPAAGFAILAESASTIGATLHRSPTLAAGQSPLAFPGVRDWLTFTTERSDERNLLLIVGVAERSPLPDSAPYLRPIGPGTAAQGHFHAAVFPYRPVPKGRLELKETVSQLLGTESARTVMHLLADEREFEGVGQTDLMRGACWVSPLRLLGKAP